MDAAKNMACETAAELIEQYGPGADLVVITMTGCSREVYDGLMKRFGPSSLDSDLEWGGERLRIVTHSKHCRISTGVILNASWIETTEVSHA